MPNPKDSLRLFLLVFQSEGIIYQSKFSGHFYNSNVNLNLISEGIVTKSYNLSEVKIPRI